MPFCILVYPIASEMLAIYIERRNILQEFGQITIYLDVIGAD
jgi:hypothetical protein